MAGAGGSTTKKGRAAHKKGGGNGFVTLIILIVPVALFVLPTALLLVVGMIPTLVAYITDRDADRTASITVGAINICGVLPFELDLWKHQHNMRAAMHLLSDPLTWLVMYGAAALGWCLYFLVPPIVTNVEVMRAQARIDTMTARKRKLTEEWGPEVATDEEGKAKA